MKKLLKKLWATIVAIVLFVASIASSFGHEMLRVPTTRVRREETQRVDN